MEAQNLRSKYFLIDYLKEIFDSNALKDKIRDSGWVVSDMIIVNCSPDYSSKLTQHLNHGLSHLNNHELFEVRDLNMPYPTMNQVWDCEDRCYKQYIKYLADWVRRNIYRNERYLFVDSGTLRGSNFSHVRTSIKGKIDIDDYKFASLYVQDDSIFTPDYFIEKFNKQTQGGLLFQWENMNNPNWDY